MNLRGKPNKRDLIMIAEGARRARPLNQIELAELRKLLQLPPAIDYSQYLTLIRSQENCGGCGTMTTMAIFDILKKRERPYSPDASYHFAEYIYNMSSPTSWREDPNLPPDPRVPAHPPYGLGQGDVLISYGCCSEASFPTNYDPPNAGCGESPPLSQRPTPMDFSEARHYRLSYASGEIKQPTVDQVKRLLFLYGPLFAADVILGHVFAIIGYDDNKIAQDGLKGGFIGVNSYGDQENDNGMWCFSYELFTKLVKEQPSLYLVYYKNDPTPPYVHPFTGRIKIRTTNGRRYLTVKIGVEGQVPKVVWDRPCQVTMFDPSLNLTYDFPLPAYARRFWPPNELNRWYVEIIDSSPSSSSETAGVWEEIILVKRNVRADGKCIPELFRPSARGIPIIQGGNVKIYIPTRKSYSLHLTADHTGVTKGNSLVLSGTAFLKLEVSSNRNAYIPQSGQEINIYKIEHLIADDVFKSVGTVLTDEHGKYSLSYVPTETSDYQAIAIKPDNIALANSNIIKVEVV